MNKLINKMKSTMLGFSLAIYSSLGFSAGGLVRTEAGLTTLQNAIHVIVGIVLVIGGYIICSSLWSGKKTVDEIKPWAGAIIFGSCVVEVVNMIYFGK